MKNLFIVFKQLMQKIRYKKDSMWKTLLIMLFGIGLGSCTLGPDFFRPFNKAETVSSYLNEPESPMIGRNMGQWWREIDDPLLDDYIEQLLTQNLALQQAGERIVQAQEGVKSAKGAYLPTLSANGSANRSFSPGQSGSGFDDFIPGGRRYTTSYAAELQTSWEIDLFGRVRRSVEAADANFKATIYDHEALTHSLIAELLNRRIAISVNKRLLALAEQNTSNRSDFADSIKRRYDLGTQSVDATDVYLARENFNSTQADIFNYRRLLAEQAYELDVLLGQVPGTTDPFASEFPILPPPLNVAVCLPADLLDRRPDLRASELRVKAANADVGVAIADLYPSLSLSGALGFNGETTNGLFTAEQLAGSIAGSIMTRLFEGGRLRSNIRIQESEARELAAAYGENILNAMREVETALRAEEELAKELQSLGASVQSLRKAEEFSNDRYLRGIETLQNLLDTQQRLYATEQALLLTQQQKWNTRTALYLALGGDWLSNDNAPACPSAGEIVGEEL